MNSTEKVKNWLITGGCGFIGTALIPSLLKQGANVNIRVLDNLSVGDCQDLLQICNDAEIISPSPSETPSTDHEFIANETHQGQLQQTHQMKSTHSVLNHPSQRFELFVGDIKDFETCYKATQDCDLIVHLAANTGVGPSVLDPNSDCQANVIGTLNMLEAARAHHIDRFIFASSGAPIGEVEPPIHEDLAPKPVSPYGASKLAGEGYCSAYYRTFGLKTVALRFGNVYGPGSTHKSSVVAKFIKQTMNGDICTIYGDGNQTRDFIFIDDLIQAILSVANFGCRDLESLTALSKSPLASFSRTNKALQQAPWGEVFQIATNKEHTINELATMLQSCLYEHGLSMDIEYGEPQPGDIKRNYSDTSKAKQILGWECQVPLELGLQRTVEWFLGEGTPSDHEH